jgi:hypothetical protein
MERTLTIATLALTGVFIACGAHAAEIGDEPGVYREAAAVMGPGLALGPTDDQRDVIVPSSSIDPGMALDPPQTGAKMPVIRPPGARDNRLVLPK